MNVLSTQLRPSSLKCAVLKPVQRVMRSPNILRRRATAGDDSALIEFPRRQQLYEWISTRPPGDVVFRVYALVTATGVGVFLTAPDELFPGANTDAASLLGVFILITFAVERFLEPLRSFLDLDGVQQEEMDKMSSKMGKAIAMLQKAAPELNKGDLVGAAAKLSPGILWGMAEQDEDVAMAETGGQTQKRKDVAVVKAALVDAQISQVNLARVKMNTAVIFWGVASCVSMLLAEAAHVGILHVVGLEDVSVPLDLIVTGLAVGAGTKPINQLISKLEDRRSNAPWN